MSCGEFDLIARYFTRDRASRKDVQLSIGDDCALMTLAENQQLAVSTDTLVCGIHFLPDIDPADLGYKALAVNLSDLAAMGATPAWLSLAITLPEVQEPWLAEFSRSMFELADYYSVQLVGGDTTKGPLSLTLTVFGQVPYGKALTRSGAHPGDWIYVTGTPGDSAAGLAILQQRLQVSDPDTRAYLLQRHLRPSPRILVGQALAGIASSCLDLSDGLASDLRHILKRSHCGARLELDKLPYSPALRSVTDLEQAQAWALAGGEDYELCFTVPEVNRLRLDTALANLGVSYSCIGQITAQEGRLEFIRDGEVQALDLHGFDHFGG